MGKTVFLSFCATFAGMVFSAQASVVSHFNGSDDGWVVADVPGGVDYVTVLNTFPLDWHAAGGHPDGYVSAADPSEMTYTFQAPAAYLGDQSTYIGGMLNFSLQTDNGNWDLDRVVAFVGNNGMCIVAPISVPTPVNTWVDYSIPLVPASFLYDGLGGAPVSVADFNAVMADLEALRISAEYATPLVETTGLDSVELVPEPGTLILLALAVGTLRRPRHRTRPVLR